MSSWAFRAPPPLRAALPVFSSVTVVTKGTPPLDTFIRGALQLPWWLMGMKRSGNKRGWSEAGWQFRQGSTLMNNGGAG